MGNFYIPDDDPGAYERERREDDRAEARDRELEAAAGPRCPVCHSDDIGRGHHEGNALAPECDYEICYFCDHQWGHE